MLDHYPSGLLKQTRGWVETTVKGIDLIVLKYLQKSLIAQESLNAFNTQVSGSVTNAHLNLYVICIYLPADNVT